MDRLRRKEGIFMERLTDILNSACDEYVQDCKCEESVKYANLFTEKMNDEDPSFMWDLSLTLLKASSNETLSEDERQICRIFGVIFTTLVLEKFNIDIEELFDSPESDEVMGRFTPEMAEELMSKILNE